jgi:hypothetical protein
VYCTTYMLDLIQFLINVNEFCYLFFLENIFIKRITKLIFFILYTYYFFTVYIYIFIYKVIVFLISYIYLILTNFVYVLVILYEFFFNFFLYSIRLILHIFFLSVAYSFYALNQFFYYSLKIAAIFNFSFYYILLYFYSFFFKLFLLFFKIHIYYSYINRFIVTILLKFLNFLWIALLELMGSISYYFSFMFFFPKLFIWKFIIGYFLYSTEIHLFFIKILAKEFKFRNIVEFTLADLLDWTFHSLLLL